MDLTRTFPGVRFSATHLEELRAVYLHEATEAVRRYYSDPVKDVSAWRLVLSVRRGHEDWGLDTWEEFIAELDQPYNQCTMSLSFTGYGAFVPSINVFQFETYASARLSHEDKPGLTRMLRVLTKAAATPEAQLPQEPEPEPYIPPPPVVFIGHGGASPVWRELQGHLRDQQGYQVEAFEAGARSGHHIRDILDEMAGNSMFAVLVMTGEDEQADGTMRARENVVHEAGLFQGRLGFSRAVILLEEGVKPFSNLAGVQYIPFPKGHIRAAYGDVLATLRREFGPR